MTQSIVICEKPSQAANIRAAVGNRFGQVMPALGHLLELAEPQDVRPEWRTWSTELLHPGGPYPTKPVRGKTSILDGIRRALRQADSAIVATDLGREGHLIAMEIIEHAGFQGPVSRACFNAEDPETLRAAFGDLRPIGEFEGLLGAGKARAQADQICNLTLTRAATVHLTKRGSGALGIGRVRTPTLAIVCRRENEITSFTPQTSWVVEAAVTTAAGEFTATCRRAPGGEGPITDKGRAEAIAEAVRDRAVTITATSKTGRQGPPAPHDLAALQADAARKLKWSAKRTLDIAQQLYSDLKIITYPRVDARVLPEAMAADAPAIRDAIRNTIGGEPGEPVLRTGATRRHHFSDKRMQGHEHHAIIPNVRTAADMKALWQRADADQRSLAEIILRRYAAMTDADWTWTELTLSFGAGVPGGTAEFSATGRTTDGPGWTRWERPPPKEPKQEGEPAEGKLPEVRNGDAGRCTGAGPAERRTRPPARYGDGTLITAMKESWRFLPEGELRSRLKEAGGIGRPATRDRVVETLVRQGQLAREKNRLKPTETGMALWTLLETRAPALVDPGTTAAWEAEFDRLAEGDGAGWMELVGRLAAEAESAVAGILGEPAEALAGLGRGRHRAPGQRRAGGGAGKGPASDRQAALIRKLAGERGETLDEGRIASMTAAEASAEIDRLMAAPRTDGGGGTGARDRAPTPARLKYAEDLAARHGVELPEDCRTDWRRAKAFIDKWAGK